MGPPLVQTHVYLSLCVPQKSRAIFELPPKQNLRARTFE